MRDTDEHTVSEEEGREGRRKREREEEREGGRRDRLVTRWYTLTHTAQDTRGPSNV